MLSFSLRQEKVLNRAKTQSCGGCHALSRCNSLCGALIWPASNSFTHVDKLCNLSSALTVAFLPHRSQGLTNDLQNVWSGGSIFRRNGSFALCGSSTH